jgi:hypothetical protein
MNVRPKNYAWTDFYDNVLDVTRHAYSLRSIWRRHRAVRQPIPRWMNALRALSAEGRGRIRYNAEIRRRLDADPQFRPFFEQQTDRLPDFYIDRMRRELGTYWRWLPDGAAHHDPRAFLREQEGLRPPGGGETPALAGALHASCGR